MELVGRNGELDRIGRMLDDEGEARALILLGEAGAGKTAVLTAGTELARERGWRVLGAAPVEPEADLPLAGFRDLVVDVPHGLLCARPEPQRRALDVALLHAEPAADAPPPTRHALAVAFLGVLRDVADADPVLVVVDDVQWLDEPTLEVLRFAARRLDEAPVRFLLAERTVFGAGGAAGPQTAWPGAEPLPVGPLSVGDISHICRVRFGPSLPRPLLARVHATSGGNPLFALEMARMLQAGGESRDPGRSVPVPDDVRQLLRRRLGALPAAVRRALAVAAALLSPTTTELLAAGVDPSAIDAAVADGLLSVDDTGSVRFCHPLYGASALEVLGPMAGRALHGLLAGVVTDPDERARHLARSVDAPSEAVAAEVSASADRVARRGHPDAAGALFEVAELLTPPGSPERLRRRVQAAANHMYGGAVPHGRALLQQALPDAPRGRERAELLFMLAASATDRIEDSRALLREARDEPFDDPVLACRIAIYDAYLRNQGGDVAGAVEDARAALAIAPAADEQLVAHVEHHLLAMERNAGLPLRWDLYEHSVDVELRLGLPALAQSAQVEYGIALMCDDRHDEARTQLEHAVRRGEQGGDEVLRGEALFHLAQAELRADRFEDGLRHAREALELSMEEYVGGPSQDVGAGLFMEAHALALLGDLGAARASATRGAELSAGAGDPFYALQNQAVLGLAALSEGDVAGAAEVIGDLPDRLVDMGRRDTSYCPFIALAIESVIGVGDLARAERMLLRFESAAQRLERRTALAQAARVRGLLLAAGGEPAAGVAHLEEALAHHRSVSTRFERAWTQLSLGATLRRLKRKRDARLVLEDALATFVEVEAPRWADRTRAELARIGGRPAATGALTQSEQRVAELVAAGRTNREVAAELFLSVRTVEANLSRVYAKLGLRSRAELAKHHASNSPTG